jgi:hypothetical protein
MANQLKAHLFNFGLVSMNWHHIRIQILTPLGIVFLDILSFNPPNINISSFVDPSVDFIKTTGVSLSDSANEHVTQEDMWDDKRFDTKIMRRCRLLGR